MSGDVKKIRVMFSIARLGFGGTEQQLFHLVAGLDRTRFEPCVMAIESGGEFFERFEQLGIPVYVVGRHHKFDPTILTRAASIVNRHKPDIVYSLLRTANFWGRMAAMLASAPVVIGGERGVLRGRKNYEFIPDRVLGRYSDLVIVNAPAVKNAYVKQSGLPDDMVVVVPNGIDMERNRPGLDATSVRDEFSIPRDALVIGTVSRLHPRKGIEYFIDALGKVLPEYPDAKALIAGDGPMRGELEQRAGQLPCADRIVFAGFRKDVNVVMNAMDIFVFPSLTEGLPNVLVEAAACARAIVACNNEENRFIVLDGETALMVPPGDADAMAGAVRKMAGNPLLRKKLSASARESVVSRFSIHSMVNSHEKLFVSIYEKKISGKL